MSIVNHNLLNSLKKACVKDDNTLNAILAALDSHGLLDEVLQLSTVKNFNPRAYGKIVIIGATKIAKNVMLAIGSKHNIMKNRFEFVDDYCDAKNYQIQKMRNNNNYAAVIVAAIPHKTVSTGDFSSLVSALRNTPGYPSVIHDKNLSKTAFDNYIEWLINQGLVAVN